MLVCLRLFGVLAEPCSVTYAKVRALVRTCQEPQKSIKLSVFNDYVRLFEFWQRSYYYVLAISGKTKY